MPGSLPVQSVFRALEILELVAKNVDGMTLDEIASRTGLNKTTAHNLVRTLRLRGYLEQGANRRLFMGGAVQELWLSRERQDVFLRAEAEVRRLHKRYPSATINVCELVGSEISCRMRMAADCPGVLRRPRAQFLNPYTSAAGLCFFAFNVNFRERMDVSHPMDESSQHLWKSAQEFIGAREAAARRGVAVIRSGSRLRIAAPVSDVFSVGLQGDAATHTVDELCADVLEAAEAISTPPVIEEG